MNQLTVSAIITAGVLFISLVYGILTTINGLRNERDGLQKVANQLLVEKALEQGNNATLRAQLQDLTAANDKLHDKYNGVLVTLTKLRAEPAKVRYEKVYKYIDKEVKSDECEDIKRSIDGTVSYINTRMQ
jgi:cell division protein FtsB